MQSTTCGKGASATKLGSNPDLLAASCSSVPLSVGVLLQPLAELADLAGLAAQSSICASSWSG